MKRLFLSLLIIVIIIGAGCNIFNTDDNGNGDPVDTILPVITDVSTSDIIETSAIITWTTDEPADSQVEYGNTDVYGTSSNLATTLVTSHTVTLEGLTPDTVYHFRVKCSDVVGNQAISDDYTFTTLEPDTTPPLISGITATSTSETSATVIWTTDELSASQVEYGTSVSYGQTIQHSTLQTSHSVTLNGLVQDTAYHFRVVSSDGAGNEATSADDTFTTLAVDPDGVETAAAEDGIFALVNAERTSRGLSALAPEAAPSIPLPGSMRPASSPQKAISSTKHIMHGSLPTALVHRVLMKIPLPSRLTSA